jgi:acetate kinase
LVINAGSSSVKFGLFQFDDLEPVARGLLDWAGDAHRATVTLRPERGEAVRRRVEVADYRSGVEAALGMLQESGLVETESAGPRRGIRVVGHRLIHGGEEIRRPVRIDVAMKRTIARYAHLAPLHIPAGLQAIEATESSLPGVPQVGLFDTAFFAHIPPCDYIYPLPYEWYRDWGIRRYGFHGTSHAYCTGRATEMLRSSETLQARDDLRLVICHLGQGSSAAAVRDGRAITNTMGFTPLEGFPMGTRCGTVDPGVLLYVLREKGVSVEQLDEALHKQSGLLGISGVSADFRRVETAAAEGHQRAQLALDVYAHRVKMTIGALATALGGLDALVFTGGIGENSHRLRQQVCEGMGVLGIHLDADRNASCRPDTDVATDDSPCRVLVVHTREDLMIARESRRLVSQDA